MKTEIYPTSIEELAAAIGRLARRVRTESAPHDFSWTQGAVLARLARNGPATIADLARAESMKPQSMGAVVASLEEKSLVERQPHPTDGRQVLITLTPAGVALREETHAAKVAWLARAVSQLQPEEQQALFQAAEILKQLSES
jgi:DNA-binding MarR family transcriptional regulator